MFKHTLRPSPAQHWSNGMVPSSADCAYPEVAEHRLCFDADSEGPKPSIERLQGYRVTA